MLMMLIMIMLISSISFMLVTHPLSLGLILLIQTIMVTIISGIFNYNFWFSYIMFLIMIGGMLVLFIYMTSVASNEKFMFSYNILMLLIMSIITLLLLTLLKDQFILNMNNLYTETFMNNNNFNLSLNKFLNFPMNMIMILIIIYLLITLIAIVKITDIKKGPLRQTN